MWSLGRRPCVTGEIRNTCSSRDSPLTGGGFSECRVSAVSLFTPHTRVTQTQTHTRHPQVDLLRMCEEQARDAVVRVPRAGDLLLLCSDC